jgi:hypothetical protein
VNGEIMCMLEAKLGEHRMLLADVLLLLLVH